MTDITTTEGDTNTEVKKPVKEILVIQDQGFFQHDTGDTYEGYFEAKKKERSVKMHGPGLYTTAEGDCYMGTWEADKLSANEEISITFTDTSRYEGMLKDWCFTGPGKYFYADGSVLHAEFTDNCPIGHMILIDPNEHPWLGIAQQGYGWFEPVNHYYEILEKTRDTERSKRRHMKKIVAQANQN